ncbi:hypothetical protein BSL78_18765 [Apostichopus japonicus]|uniref:Uncharacterized protein n=1 Tax=Stichopus japonicus TaxID=307972 RepID=A0A2G8K8N2_STIJA|nr:hypothetical protein BSL78_18765 [Apostichopus japonicus]
MGFVKLSKVIRSPGFVYFSELRCTLPKSFQYMPVELTSRTCKNVQYCERFQISTQEAFHKKYSRKVQKARSLEEFVQVFDKTDDITGTLERLLDASLRDSIDSNQLTKGPSSIMNSQFFQNVTTDAVEQIKEQERLQECREPRPVLLDSHEVIGLDKGLLHLCIHYAYKLTDVEQQQRLLQHRDKDMFGEGRTYHKCYTTGTPSLLKLTLWNADRILFAFVYIDKSGSASRQREMKVYTAQVEEHTLCECQESALTREKCNDIICESPKTKNPIDCNCLCPKRCANPYRNNNETCECECGDEQTPAGRIAGRSYGGKPPCLEVNAIRAVKEPPPIKSAQHDVGIVPFVRSSQAHLERNSKEVISTVILKKETIPNPLLSGESPDRNEYRHSSHTRYNETQHIHGKHNVSASTKAQITVLNQAADDLNATNIKDRYRVDLKPNGTDHGTIPGPGTATTDVIGKAEKRENPLGLQESEEEINDITSFDYYVDTTEERSSSSSSYEYSSSSS